MEHWRLRVRLCPAGFSGNGFSCKSRTVIWSTGDCVFGCVVLVLVESDSVVQVGLQYRPLATVMLCRAGFSRNGFSCTGLVG